MAGPAAPSVFALRMRSRRCAVRSRRTVGTPSMRTAERLRTTLQEQPILFEGTPIAVTASLGIGALDATIADENGLIAAADAALYSAKRSGRNRAVLHEERQSA